VALTLCPMLASRMLTKDHDARAYGPARGIGDAASRFYAGILQRLPRCAPWLSSSSRCFSSRPRAPSFFAIKSN
jgi:multidrug efflux pump subunit AcrB